MGTDLVDVGDELAACLVEQGHQGMTIEVDPYQATGDTALESLVARLHTYILIIAVILRAGS